MFISAITLENFRNLKSLDLKFNQGFVVLSGPNSAGKTNFLEALYFGGTLRRFPDSEFGQLFSENQNFFRIRLIAQNQEPEICEVYTELRLPKHLYKFKINGQEVTRNKYQRGGPFISFLPQDLNLLTRSPSGRRRFLNEILFATSVSYRHAYEQYEKALKQRNTLLEKNGEVNAASVHSEMEIWDERLAEYGSQVTDWRDKLLEYLTTNLPAVINQLSPDLAKIRFVYQPSGRATKPDFLELLRELHARERHLGMTTIGPHRDDFETLFGDKKAVGFISRGQLRSITLAIKILEKQYVEKNVGYPSIMLLDDVFSEFDFEHQKKLIEFLHDFNQAFLTTAHLEEIQNYLPRQAQVFRVEQGVIQSV